MGTEQMAELAKASQCTFVLNKHDGKCFKRKPCVISTICNIAVSDISQSWMLLIGHFLLIDLMISGKFFGLICVLFRT